MARKTTLAAWALLGLAGCSDRYATECPKHYADILALEGALQEFATLHGGKYPDSLDALAVPDELGFRLIRSEEVPLDPWGSAYRYEPPAAEGELPRVYTYGSDGMPGGKGDAQDIDNWMIRRASGSCEPDQAAGGRSNQASHSPTTRLSRSRSRT